MDGTEQLFCVWNGWNLLITNRKWDSHMCEFIIEIGIFTRFAADDFTCGERPNILRCDGLFSHSKTFSSFAIRSRIGNVQRSIDNVHHAWIQQMVPMLSGKELGKCVLGGFMFVTRHSFHWHCFERRSLQILVTILLFTLTVYHLRPDTKHIIFIMYLLYDNTYPPRSIPYNCNLYNKWLCEITMYGMKSERMCADTLDYDGKNCARHVIEANNLFATFGPAISQPAQFAFKTMNVDKIQRWTFVLPSSNKKCRSCARSAMRETIIKLIWQRLILPGFRSHRGGLLVLVCPRWGQSDQLARHRKRRCRKRLVTHSVLGFIFQRNLYFSWVRPKQSHIFSSTFAHVRVWWFSPPNRTDINSSLLLSMDLFFNIADGRPLFGAKKPAVAPVSGFPFSLYDA